jgi:hypothetical protein
MICLLVLTQFFICMYFGVSYVSSAIIEALPKATVTPTMA